MILGYLDVICTGVGGGLYDPQGRVGCTIIGSTGMHMRIAPTPESVKLNAGMSGYTMAFPKPGMQAQMQSNMASTINIDWLLDVALDVLKMQGLDRTRSDILKGLDDQIAACTPGKLLYHPYISTAGERGPFLDPNARAMFTGLEVGTGYADMMRAIFEGICFAARDCYTAMGGIPPEIRVTGGAARSKALRLILASALQAGVRTVTREEAGAAGAAMMAAIQQKIYAGMDDCTEAWVTPALGEVTQPDTKLARIYDAAFAEYKSLRNIMHPIWGGLAAVRAENRSNA